MSGVFESSSIEIAKPGDLLPLNHRPRSHHTCFVLYSSSGSALTLEPAIFAQAFPVIDGKLMAKGYVPRGGEGFAVEGR